MNTRFAASCPVPLAQDERVQLAHGGGGRLTRQLIDRVFLPAFDNAALAARHDSAILALGGARLAFTTDAYVVEPRTFPGGDVGALAVHGTVNDLAMAGARSAALSAAFILEEGFALDELRAVVASMRDAAAACGATLVTGDTKVVDRGKADGVFVVTSGVGLVPPGVDVRPARVRPGDAVLLSGDVGRHGVAVLSVRDGLAFESPVESDCAPLLELVASLLDAGVDVRCLRDATRGGLATALNEIALDAGRDNEIALDAARDNEIALDAGPGNTNALDAGLGIEVDEARIPVSDGVAAACELLGLDPLYVACEGRMVAFVPDADAARALDALRAHPLGARAERIGTVVAGARGRVVLRTRVGTRRLLDLLSGEQLPRIC